MPPLPNRRHDVPTTAKPLVEGVSRGARSAPHTPFASPSAVSDHAQERFAQELQRAKLDAMKELAYGASHEINNPLANIALRAQALLKREGDPENQKALRAIHRQAMRAHEMISDLMLFARPPEPRQEATRITEVIHKVIEAVDALATDLGVALSWDCPVSLCAWADPMQLAVALRAVVENSVEACGQGGAASIDAYDASGWVVIEVSDNGPGVPQEILPHVFDPFFSGREAGRGLGFGLSKCWRIVTDHGGDVRLENRSAGGVLVTMRLPAAAGTL